MALDIHKEHHTEVGTFHEDELDNSERLPFQVHTNLEEGIEEDTAQGAYKHREVDNKLAFLEEPYVLEAIVYYEVEYLAFLEE